MAKSTPPSPSTPPNPERKPAPKVEKRQPEKSGSFQPYVSPEESSMPEFTWQAVVTGSILGIIFAASSLYLVLKVGMTVSASIPIAVLSITSVSRLLQTAAACGGRRSSRTTSCRRPARPANRSPSAWA